MAHHSVHARMRSRGYPHDLDAQHCGSILRLVLAGQRPILGTECTYVSPGLVTKTDRGAAATLLGNYRCPTPTNEEGCTRSLRQLRF